MNIMRYYDNNKPDLEMTFIILLILLRCIGSVRSNALESIYTRLEKEGIL